MILAGLAALVGGLFAVWRLRWIIFGPIALIVLFWAVRFGG